MALIDNNQIFNEFAYIAKTQVETQKTDLFNAESQGALSLMPAPFTGDFYREASFKRIADLLQIEDGYVDEATRTADITQLQEISVKVLASTPAVRMDKHTFDWIQQSPEYAAAAYGQQLAVASVKLKLNTLLQALVTCLLKTTGAILDKKGTTANVTNQLDIKMLIDAAQKFGDASGDLKIIVCHSNVWASYVKRNLDQWDQLFTYGTVNVRKDISDRLFLVTDAPALTFQHNSITKYRSLLLAPGAGVIMEDPTLYRTNIDDTNDRRLIKTTVKSQLGFGVHVKNHNYIGTNKSPTETELAAAASWGVSDSNIEIKEYPGILIEHQA